MNENENVVVEPIENEGATDEVKTYTQDEVDKLLQSETDRRITSALAKQKKDYEKKLSLSKLDGVERERAEAQQTISELQAKLAEYEIEKNRSELKTVLSNRGLSAQFADLIHITDDLTESQARIDALDKLFKQAVADEVKRRIGGTKPQVSTDRIDANAFKKMTLAERQALMNTDPELYKTLRG